MKTAHAAKMSAILDLPPVKRPSKKVLAKLHAMKRLKGKIAVIDPESGDYFIAPTLMEGLLKAKAKYPGHIFYSIRIGYNFAHEHRGAISRA